MVGGILGIAAAGVTVLGMSRALDGAGGASFPVPWAEMGGVLGGCLLIAMIASLIPTVLQLRSTRTPRPKAVTPPPARGGRRLPRRWSRRCTAAPDRRYIPRPAVGRAAPTRPVRTLVVRAGPGRTLGVSFRRWHRSPPSARVGPRRAVGGAWPAGPRPSPTRSVPGRRAQFLPGAPPVATAAQVSRPRHRGTS
ncbi:hypothetical protein OIM90_16675 [Streptomyces sp. AD16]|nr:hypothetical protein OIM90_16675 [Streptomyces sp. AD16]